MVDRSMNMVVIDLGDAIKYESHPEIAVKNHKPFKTVWLTAPWNPTLVPCLDTHNAAID